MKRSAFLAYLLGAVGIGKAQGVVGASMAQANQTEFVVAKREPATSPGRHADVNNQCPVCLKMAEPFRINKNTRTVESVWTVGVGVNLTRCKRCNAAFWQDAEE